MTDTDLKNIWIKLIEKYKQEIGEESVHQLLRNSYPVNLDGNNLLVVVPNQFMKMMFQLKEENLKPLIDGLFGQKIHLIVESLESADGEEQAENTPSNTTVIPIDNFDTNLNKKFTFENFVIGNNTRLVYAAAKRIVETPGKIYNPLFVYGKPGLGKTHIIQAIGNQLRKKNPQMKVFYTSTEAFTNDLIMAIQHKTTEAFHEKYRQLDCLIIDDIQQLKGKERTQEEFFNTFNALESVSKQIIIASDRIPQEIETLQDRITSRLSKGFLGDIQQPDFETRLAILNLKLEERNITLTEDCKNIICTAIKTDIRVMESICNRIQILSEIGEKITQDTIVQELRKFSQEPMTEEITFDKILNVVSQFFGISKEDILSKKRNAKINFPRQIIMYLSRKKTNLSLSQIGKELGGKDHSTIIHGFEKLNQAIENNDSETKSILEIIISRL